MPSTVTSHGTVVSALKRTRPDILLFLAATLKSCPHLRQAGPALQVSDIPEEYGTRFFKGKNWTVKEKQKLFWEKVPHIATWDGVGYHLTDQPVDTTFAMRHRDASFRRLSHPAVRAYAPFAAVHVDWYQHKDRQKMVPGPLTRQNN